MFVLSVAVIICPLPAFETSLCTVTLHAILLLSVLVMICPLPALVTSLCVVTLPSALTFAVFVTTLAFAFTLASV